MNYGYVYLTTNLINGKKYIGQHKSEKWNPNYLGSGRLITEAVDKYGKDNFSSAVLEWASSSDELNDKEVYYINLYNAADSDDFYNLAAGGNIGLDNILSSTRDDVRKKLSDASTGQRHIYKGDVDKVININKGDNLDDYLNDGWTLGFSDKHAKTFANRGKNYSQWRSSLSDSERSEYYTKISTTLKGRRWMYKDSVEMQFKPDEVNTKLYEGWLFGRLYAHGRK